MYCENCGNKINDSDNFCEGCGKKIESNFDNISSKDRNKLKNKAWFRFFKLIYITAFSLSIVVFIFLSLKEIPEKSIDRERSFIKCDNGKKYFEEASSSYGYSDKLSIFNDQDARRLCAYTINYNDYLTKKNFSKNYEFHPVYTNPNYKEWLGYSFLSLVAILIFFKLVKFAFFYIAIGEKPNIEQEVKKIF